MSATQVVSVGIRPLRGPGHGELQLWVLQGVVTAHLFPAQHLAVQTSLLCIFHLLLLPTLPQEPPHAQTTSKLLARSLFACGISTMLQTTLGSR